MPDRRLWPPFALVCCSFAQANPILDDNPVAPNRAPYQNWTENIEFFGQIDTDYYSVLKGGIQPGAGLNALAVGGFSLGEKVLGLDDSLFTLSLMAMHTDRINQRFLGGVTNPNGDEGDYNRVVLDALFWEQRWVRQDGFGLTTKAGVFDINSEFISTASAEQLINSSFGTDPNMSENFGVSTFPKNGSGFVVTLADGDTDVAPWALKLGWMQGEVVDQTRPFADGSMWIAEGQWRPAPRNNIKLGAWTRQGSGQPTFNGAYLSTEARLNQGEQTAFDGFIRASYARGDRDLSEAKPKNYVAAGFSMDGPLPGRPKDVFTLGVGRLGLIGGEADNTGREAFVEVSYVWRLGENIALQPDIQYYRSPGGAEPNAWVGILRLHIE